MGLRRKHNDPVSSKISKLRHEGVKPKQAQAMALNMEREHRLTKGGGYKRKHKE